MSSDIWNPWHGCRKYSEGCDHCYMHYLDNERGKSGGEIYKVKTNSNLLLKSYHIFKHISIPIVSAPIYCIAFRLASVTSIRLIFSCMVSFASSLK